MDFALRRQAGASVAERHVIASKCALNGRAPKHTFPCGEFIPPSFLTIRDAGIIARRTLNFPDAFERGKKSPVRLGPIPRSIPRYRRLGHPTGQRVAAVLVLLSPKNDLYSCHDSKELTRMRSYRICTANGGLICNSNG